MFKNLIVYRFASDWQPNAEKLEAALEQERFKPCGATEALSAGWVPARGEPGARLLEEIDGHWLLSLRMEKRVLPGAVVREHVEEMMEKIELETGRRPGKKQQRDLKEQATQELLPRAFTLQSHLRVWISPKQGFLMVDAGSIGKADELITLLVKADSSINLHLLQSAESPAACMAAWLMDGVPPKDFVIDRDCEVKAADEMKAAVRYARHNLDTEEVKAHLTSGKMPTRLAMTWKERVSFTLTDTMQIKGIKFLDVVFDGRDKPAKDEAFDVDAALATGELSQLIPDLIEGLGGELDFIGQSAKIAEQHAPKVQPAVGPGRSQEPDHVSEESDPLYQEAVEVVLEHQEPSISVVQRYLKLGYNRASRLLEAMEAAGVVSEMNREGVRTLLVTASPKPGLDEGARVDAEA